MNMKSSNKWKDALLKTSLPLEYLIAEKLGKNGFIINGEYSYLRKNEQDKDAEFSVDLHASKLLDRGGEDYWAGLNLLIECKYNYPGVKWIFAPHPEESYITTGIVDVFDHLCTRQITNTAPIDSLDDNLPYCVKGIELHESDSNNQSITRGLHQLKYAVPKLAASIHQHQIFTWNDEDLNIGFICSMLVTTASLHVFKDSLSIQQFQNASNLDELTEEVDALVVFQENKPQLEDYLREIIADLHKDFPGIKVRLDGLAKIQGKSIPSILPKSYFLDSRIKSSAERILVITYDAFENMVVKIRDAVVESGKSLKQIARLKKDIAKRHAEVEPLPKESK